MTKVNGMNFEVRGESLKSTILKSTHNSCVILAETKLFSPVK